MAHLGVQLTALGRVVVVGAGWAGCAAAAELARHGCPVTLLEAGADLGGRARRVSLTLAGQPHVLDNGQHLLLGAYSHTADLFRQLDVALDAAVERRPFELRYPDGFRLQAARLPAPLHLAAALLTVRGLGAADRKALIVLMQTLKSSRWKIGVDRSLAEWLAACGQTQQVIRRVWRPLALAALNTPLERASAQIFANVLRDSLGAAGLASQMWIPRTDLSALLPDAVERYVARQGGRVQRDSRVERITHSHDERFELYCRGTDPPIRADAVVYAAAPAYLERIGAALPSLTQAMQTVSRFAYEPIYTVYLKYPPATRVARGFMALADDPARRRYAQWLFDRGRFGSANAGVLAAVISGSGLHQDEAIDDVCRAVAAQLTDALSLPVPLGARAVAERRATLAAVPGLERPQVGTPYAGFVLAGDWTASEYPSTLETAVRSGRAAARLLLDRARQGARTPSGQ